MDRVAYRTKGVRTALRLRSIALLLCALASSVKARADITVTITQPATGAVVGDRLDVSATVGSTYQVSRVRADAQGVVTDLAYSNGAWGGALSLGSLPWGTTMVSVVATDVLAQTGASSVTFAHDLPPTVDFVNPGAWRVFRPGDSVAVSATCADDNPAGCSQITLYENDGTVLASGTGTLATTISLASYDGQAVKLVLYGTDSAGQRVIGPSRTVYVEGSQRLVPIEVVAGGLYDFDDTRVLYVDRKDQWHVRDRSTGTEGLIAGIQGPATKGKLISKGAIWEQNRRILEWRGGQVSDITGASAVIGLAASPHLGVNGNFAIWATSDFVSLLQPTTASVILRTLDAGTNKTLWSLTGAMSTEPPYAAVSESALTSTGEAAFATADDYYSNGGGCCTYRDHLQIYRGGVTTPTSTFVNSPYPLAFDGENVVYAYSPANYPSYPQAYSSIDLYSQSVDTQLDLRATLSADPYALSNGWLAYTKAINGSVQVIRRSPTQDEEQLTIFGSDSSIAAMSPQGAVMISNGGKLYLSDSAATTDLVASAVGTPTFFQGHWYVVLGDTLFTLGTWDGGVATSDGGFAGDVSSDPEPTEMDASNLDASLSLDVSVTNDASGFDSSSTNKDAPADLDAPVDAQPEAQTDAMVVLDGSPPDSAIVGSMTDGPKSDGPDASISMVGTACIPGTQIACPCIGGARGVQICVATGTAFGPCMGCTEGDGSAASSPPNAECSCSFLGRHDSGSRTAAALGISTLLLVSRFRRRWRGPRFRSTA